jgi:GDP-L-fucose synthase
MEKYEAPETINVGTGEEISIAELGSLMKQVVGLKAEIGFDTTKPDGTPRKVCEVSKVHALGWRHQIKLKEGLESTYRWALENKAF